MMNSSDDGSNQNNNYNNNNNNNNNNSIQSAKDLDKQKLLFDTLFPKVNIQITSTRDIVEKDKKSHTLYNILVTPVDKSFPAYNVEHRFSDFDDLYKALINDMDLPALPSKTWFKSFTSDFIATRQRELELWLNELNKNIFAVKSKQFQYFLLIENHLQTKNSLDEVIKIKSISDDQFGVTGLYYLESEMVLLTACEDAHLLSRLDSKLSNLKLPWENTRDPSVIVPVGGLNCWRVDNSSQWKLVSTLYYDQSATAISVWPSKHLVAVGLEHGSIVLYKANDTWVDFTEIARPNSHPGGRVSSLTFVPKMDALVSCGRDKRLVVYSVKDNAEMSATLPGKSWMSALVLEESTQRVIVSTYAQEILIYDINTSVSPTLLLTIPAHNGSIRSLSFSPSARYMFSGSFDASVGIWSVPNGAREMMRSRVVGYLKGGPKKKVKSIAYCHALGFVFAGHEGGRISVWQASSGKLLNVFIAHTVYDVTFLQWLDESEILLSAGLDGHINWWKFAGTLASPSSQLNLLNTKTVSAPLYPVAKPAESIKPKNSKIDENENQVEENMF